jgi:hypothetical protein
VAGWPNYIPILWVQFSSFSTIRSITVNAFTRSSIRALNITPFSLHTRHTVSMTCFQYSPVKCCWPSRSKAPSVHYRALRIVEVGLLFDEREGPTATAARCHYLTHISAQFRFQSVTRLYCCWASPVQSFPAPRLLGIHDQGSLLSTTCTCLEVGPFDEGGFGIFLSYSQHEYVEASRRPGHLCWCMQGVQGFPVSAGFCSRLCLILFNISESAVSLLIVWNSEGRKVQASVIEVSSF